MGIPTGHGNRFVPHEFVGGSKSTPAIINQLANVCRRECHVNNNSPAASQPAQTNVEGLKC